MVKLPFRFLAGAARAAGVDSLVINPGTVPLGRIAGPVLASFADGAVPDAERPDRIARIGEGSQAPLQPLADVDLPAGLIDALIEVLQRDPGVRRAVLGVRPMGEAMAFTVFVNRDGVDQGHITEKLADVAIHQIGEPNYFAAVFVDDSAAELNDPERTIDLV